MATRAYKVMAATSLKGSKMWITNSPVADVFVVWAKSHRRRRRGARSAALCWKRAGRA